MIVLSSLLSSKPGICSLRFQKGLEQIQFLIYKQADVCSLVYLPAPGALLLHPGLTLFSVASR
jgi:hypothetical protein